MTSPIEPTPDVDFLTITIPISRQIPLAMREDLAFRAAEAANLAVNGAISTGGVAYVSSFRSRPPRWFEFWEPRPAGWHRGMPWPTA